MLTNLRMELFQALVSSVPVAAVRWRGTDLHNAVSGVGGGLATLLGQQLGPSYCGHVSLAHTFLMLNIYIG